MDHYLREVSKDNSVNGLAFPLLAWHHVCSTLNFHYLLSIVDYTLVPDCLGV